MYPIGRNAKHRLPSAVLHSNGLSKPIFIWFYDALRKLSVKHWLPTTISRPPSQSMNFTHRYPLFWNPGNLLGRCDSNWLHTTYIRWLSRAVFIGALSPKNIDGHGQSSFVIGGSSNFRISLSWKISLYQILVSAIPGISLCSTYQKKHFLLSNVLHDCWPGIVISQFVDAQGWSFSSTGWRKSSKSSKIEMMNACVAHGSNVGVGWNRDANS